MRQVAQVQHVCRLRIYYCTPSKHAMSCIKLLSSSTPAAFKYIITHHQTMPYHASSCSAPAHLSPSDTWLHVNKAGHTMRQVAQLQHAYSLRIQYCPSSKHVIACVKLLSSSTHVAFEYSITRHQSMPYHVSSCSAPARLVPLNTLLHVIKPCHIMRQAAQLQHTCRLRIHYSTPSNHANHVSS